MVPGGLTAVDLRNCTSRELQTAGNAMYAENKREECLKVGEAENGQSREWFLSNSLLRMLQLFICCANNFKFSSLYNKSSAAKSRMLSYHVVASPPLQARYLSNYCTGEADSDLASAASSPGACPCCRLSAFYFLLSTRPACKSSLPEQPAL